MDIEANKDTSIKSWWKKVISNNKPVSSKQDENLVFDQVFGVPLDESLKCARAAIAYVDNDVQYVGFIPVIVAKCGSFLKDQGLYTEGVFRMSGSAKRIGQLQHIFNTAPDYGRQLDWKGYSVHDAANVLRRFLNYLPEPVIVHNLYQPFRDVMQLANLTEEETVAKYQSLIEQLPEYHQYLLFYLLDLLSLFSQNVQITKMDTFNLASVFTPGILLNPDHALNPAQYKTSQKVIQFLIEHQHCFKMPRSSWFTVLNQQKDEPELTTNEPEKIIDTPTNYTTTTINNDNTSSSSSSRKSSSFTPPLITHRQNSHPIYYNTINSFPSRPYQHHHQKSEDVTNKSDTVRPSSELISSTKEQRVKRAKTMPTKRSRYGPNDPLQIVQLNKSVIETAHNK